MRVYRLASQRFSANDGLGASLFGGRWNRKGTPVIYTGASRALCALEILANANALADDYMVTPIEVPEDLSVVTLSVDELPSGWDAAQPTPATAEMGTAWAEKLQSAVLIVPSAIIPQEQTIFSIRSILIFRNSLLGRRSSSDSMTGYGALGRGSNEPSSGSR